MEAKHKRRLMIFGLVVFLLAGFLLAWFYIPMSEAMKGFVVDGAPKSTPLEAACSWICFFAKEFACHFAMAFAVYAFAIAWNEIDSFEFPKKLVAIPIVLLIVGAIQAAGAIFLLIARRDWGDLLLFALSFAEIGLAVIALGFKKGGTCGERH